MARKKKYLGLSKKSDLKIRQELYDQDDYVDKLSDEDKDWLSRFNLEDISGNFEHSGERIYKEKLITKKIKSTGKEKIIDNSKKDSNKRNYDRNRDAYSKSKSLNLLMDYDNILGGYDMYNRSTNLHEAEDVMIQVLDWFKKKTKNAKKV